MKVTKNCRDTGKSKLLQALNLLHSPSWRGEFRYNAFLNGAVRYVSALDGGSPKFPAVSEKDATEVALAFAEKYRHDLPIALAWNAIEIVASEYASIASTR